MLDFLVCFFGFPLGFLGNHWDFLVLFVFLFYLAMGQNLGYLFGDDYPPKIIYFKGFWDVHRGFDPQPFFLGGTS